MTHAPPILLADDNPTDAELTIRALEIGGVSNPIVWVQDGEAALQFVFRKGVYAQRAPGNPCVMLLDLNMPKVDGLEVLAQIKGDPRTRATPVIIMSSSDQESDQSIFASGPRAASRWARAEISAAAAGGRRR